MNPRLDFPATRRNREPILAELRRLLPSDGLLLEIASGSGQHLAHFAPHFPGLRFQYSDVDPGYRRSQAAWREEARAPNLLAPIHVDATAPTDWPIDRADVIYTANMLHIAPWPGTLGLMEGAGRILPPGGLLLVYGPFQRGADTEESNLRFDQSLRSRDPAMGVRELSDVVTAAEPHGLSLREQVFMPARNMLLVFEANLATD